MSPDLENARAAIATVESILKGMRSALLAERDAKKKPLRQSTEFALVAVQADHDSAAALLAELLAELTAEEGAKQPYFTARVSALAKNAEFLLDRLSGLLLLLSAEEPLFHSYERVGENLGALARAAVTLRTAAGGPSGTAEIMSALGVH